MIAAKGVELVEGDAVPLGQETGFQSLREARRPTVLIAEDCEKVGHALQRCFCQADYIVHVAPDGITAIDAIRTLEPDVLLLDLGLPRLSGLKLLHRLRMSRIDLPVVVLTGAPHAAQWERALHFGVREVLLKPTPAREVVAAIDRLLREG